MFIHVAIPEDLIKVSKSKPETGNRRSQAERRELTQQRLLDAAREMFVERGFARAGLPELVLKAGLTRGALYHHYRNKEDLFRAVAQREAEAISDSINAATDSISDPTEAMTVGTDAYFDAMLAPGRVKILLSDAPSVMGHTEALKLTQSQGSLALRQGLKRSVASLSKAELQALTDVVSAAFDRAALKIAEGEDRKAYTQAIFRLIQKLIG